MLSGDFKSFTHKLHRCKGDVLVAFSGDAVEGMRFVDWVADGMPRDAMPDFVLHADEDEGFEAIVAYPNGKAEWWNNGMRGLSIHEPMYAIGSGGQGAMVAMLCGRTPAQAVRLAMKADGATGFGVETLIHKKNKRKSRG